MLKLFAFSLVLVLVTGHRYEVVNLTTKSQGALEFRTLALYKFKGIPEFAELKSDEKRQIFHYEQAIVVRDSGKDDDKVRRCEVLEVYKKEEAKEVSAELKNLLNVDVEEVLMDKMMDLLKDCDSVDDNVVQKSEPGANTPNLTVEKIPILDGLVPERNNFRGYLCQKCWSIDPNILAQESRSQSFNKILDPEFRSSPSTNWCGFGDSAKSYHDLNKLRNVDRCCRSHDLCPIKVLAKDNLYNLTNKAIYTKSHCRCDETLYNCLKKDDGWTAKLLGRLYFDFARPECIKGVPEKPEEEMKFVPATEKW